MLIALFPGDGIGPEIVDQAKRVLDALAIDGLTYDHGLVGGAAYKAVGHPLPPEMRRADPRGESREGQLTSKHLPLQDPCLQHGEQ